jgi:hypothetical protein
MSAFAGAEQLAVQGIEGGAPLDQFGYADRAFGDEDFGGGVMNETIAGINGVFKMKSYVGIAFHGDGDAALGVVGVGLGDGLFGDDENIAVAR